LFVPCGGLSWLPVRFLLHVKYTLSYRIVWPIAHGVLQGEPKVSDVRPVLRLTPTPTQPSAVSVFLSVAKCGRVCIGHGPAHILAQSHPLWPRGFYRVGQKFEKNSNFWPFLAFTSPISQQPLKIEAYKQRI